MAETGKATKKKEIISPDARRSNGMSDSLYSEIAIDLGTANTLIYLKNRGVVLNEPSIVALNNQGKILATGHQAQAMHEKTHRNIRTVRPLKGGVIADFGIAEMMLRQLVRNTKKAWYSRIRQMFICVPNGITAVERRAVHESAKNAGAKKVYLIEETVAAAIGTGLNVNEPVGNMIVDIGGGTTEIAIISLSGIVHSSSIRLGGDKLNEEIANFFRRNYNLLIGMRTAEMIKCTIGSAIPLDPELEVAVKGRDLVSGVPKTLPATSQDVRAAISESVNTFVQAITKSLEQTPPELAADILDRGILLTGGGAMLKGLDTLIKDATNLPIHIAEEPLTAVVRGAGKIMEDFDRYRTVVV